MNGKSLLYLRSALILTLTTMILALFGAHVHAQQTSKPSAEDVSLFFGIADPNAKGTNATHQVRFDLYKQMGIGILRVDEGGWRDFEIQPNVWQFC
jgi:hypothetical protein